MSYHDGRWQKAIHRSLKARVRESSGSHKFANVWDTYTFIAWAFLHLCRIRSRSQKRGKGGGEEWLIVVCLVITFKKCGRICHAFYATDVLNNQRNGREDMDDFCKHGRPQLETKQDLVWERKTDSADFLLGRNLRLKNMQRTKCEPLNLREDERTNAVDSLAHFQWFSSSHKRYVYTSTVAWKRLGKRADRSTSKVAPPQSVKFKQIELVHEGIHSWWSVILGML